MIMFRSGACIPRNTSALSLLIFFSINIVTSSCTSSAPIAQEQKPGLASATGIGAPYQHATSSDTLENDRDECKKHSEENFPSPAARAGKALGGLALGIIFPQAGGMVMDKAIFQDDHSEAKKSIFISCMKSRGHSIDEPRPKSAEVIAQ
ncbi:hypothetical protein [uncultured Thiodictyon sp.]|jgi:hypothetical protein|uniref:hypothetical protein n=1 Tax=uncultured Thiodictyon sp. TaxID=1846217 RepID=UPI0025D99ECB|nr:hypothetical protein [uncultured Thiodictyon sp.]